jgi:hypothetical protein
MYVLIAIILLAILALVFMNGGGLAAQAPADKKPVVKPASTAGSSCQCDGPSGAGAPAETVTGFQL